MKKRREKKISSWPQKSTVMTEHVLVKGFSVVQSAVTSRSGTSSWMRGKTNTGDGTHQ
jgi:hypothetical protein